MYDIAFQRYDSTAFGPGVHSEEVWRFAAPSMAFTYIGLLVVANVYYEYVCSLCLEYSYNDLLEQGGSKLIKSPGVNGTTVSTVVEHLRVLILLP